ncbi:MAG: ArsR family transcriptional regulator [Lentimicrobiaceae bacterium]|nr:ArsR family transcriptional regulator [Lentimicrobiaceae bacterium]
MYRLTSEEIESLAGAGEGYNVEFKVNVPAKVRELSQKLTTATEMRSFFQNSNRIYFDAVPCQRFNIDEDLDKQNFKQFLLESSISGKISTQQILNNLQTFDESGVIKNGGVLFFGQHPKTFFPHAIIHCVRFKGTSKVHIIDDKKYGGSLYQQYLQAEAWIKDKLAVSYIIKGTKPRKEVWEIPLTVFKEAIINALSHRDYYEQGAKTMIEIYDDRVEISNPGSLLVDLKSDFGKKSITRNPLIFGLFTRMNLVEQVASGIPRMRDEMREAGLPEPTFSTDGGFFTIEFRRTQDDPINFENDPINFEDIIFELIKNKEGLSAPDISKLIEKSVKTTKRYITKLKESGKIEFRGARKTGGYYLK